MSIEVFGGGKKPDTRQREKEQISPPFSGVVPKRPRSGSAPGSRALTSEEEAQIAAAMRKNTFGRDPIQRVTIPQRAIPDDEAGKAALEPFWKEVTKRLNVSNDVSEGCIQEPIAHDCIENTEADPTFRLNSYLYNQSSLGELRGRGQDPFTRERVPAAAWNVAFPPAPANPVVQPAAGDRVTRANVVLGMRVVRGPDWHWGNQDGGAIWGARNQGTVIDTLENIEGGFWVEVRWDGVNDIFAYRVIQRYDLSVAP